MGYPNEHSQSKAALTELASKILQERWLYSIESQIHV